MEEAQATPNIKQLHAVNEYHDLESNRTFSSIQSSNNYLIKAIITETSFSSLETTESSQAQAQHVNIIRKIII
jgi:hypothetical protein